MGTSRRPLLTVEIALSSALHSLPRACLLACLLPRDLRLRYATLPCLSCLVLSSQAGKQASRPRIPQFAEPEIETGRLASAPPHTYTFIYVLYELVIFSSLRGLSSLQLLSCEMDGPPLRDEEAWRRA